MTSDVLNPPSKTQCSPTGAIDGHRYNCFKPTNKRKSPNRYSEVIWVCLPNKKNSCHPMVWKYLFPGKILQYKRCEGWGKPMPRQINVHPKLRRTIPNLAEIYFAVDSKAWPESQIQASHVSVKALGPSFPSICCNEKSHTHHQQVPSGWLSQVQSNTS